VSTTVNEKPKHLNEYGTMELAQEIRRRSEVCLLGYNSPTNKKCIWVCLVKGGEMAIRFADAMKQIAVKKHGEWDGKPNN